MQDWKGGGRITVTTNQMKKMKPLKAHELADLFPEMTEAEFNGLTESIKKIGQIDDIILLDGKILEGRSRFAACKIAGIEPRTRDFDSAKDIPEGWKPKNDGDQFTPLDFVTAKNLHRRHLTTSQRATAAAMLAAESEKGRPKASETNGELPIRQDEAAQMMNVPLTAVQRATKVLKSGSKELKDALKAGKVSLSKAASVADEPKEKQIGLAKKKPAKAKIKAKKQTPKALMLEAFDTWWLDYKDGVEKLDKESKALIKDFFGKARKLIERTL